MLLSWYTGLITRPVHTIREIVDVRPIGLGLFTMLIVAVLNGIVTFGLGLDPDAFAEFGEEPVEEFGIIAIIAAAILFTVYAAVQLGIFSVIVHLVSRLFGGDGPYLGALSGFMMLSVLSLIPVIPSLIGELLGGDDGQGAFTTIAGILTVVVGVWTVILGVIVLRENYRLSTGLALLSAVGSYFAGLIIGIILFIPLIIMVIAIGLATS